MLRGNENPPTLDPAKAARTLDGHLACLLHAGLLRCGPRGQILPELARSYSFDSSGKAFQVELIPNLRFPSGRPLTAEDVAYSFNRVCRPETAAPMNWVFEDVEGFSEVRQRMASELSGIRILSSTSLEIRLAAASATFPARLAMPAARIVDREETESKGAAYGRSPRGLGAWELVEWVDDSYLRLQPNLAYPQANTRIASLEFRIVPQDFTAAALFERGGLDILFPVPVTQAYRWQQRTQPVGGLQTVLQFNVYYLGLACHRPPFDRVELRKALRDAIDVEGLRQALYGEQALAAYGPIPPGLLGSLDAPVGGLPVSRVGPENPLAGTEFDIWFVDNDSTLALAAEGIQADLDRAGAQCRLRRTDPTTYNSWRREGKFDVYLGNWWADYPDPDNFFYPLFYSGSPANSTRIRDSALDEAILKARETGDPETREALYRKAAERLADLAPAVFLWHRGSQSLTQSSIFGFEPPRLFQGTLYLEVGKSTGKVRDAP